MGSQKSLVGPELVESQDSSPSQFTNSLPLDPDRGPAIHSSRCVRPVDHINHIAAIKQAVRHRGGSNLRLTESPARVYLARICTHRVLRVRTRGGLLVGQGNARANPGPKSLFMVIVPRKRLSVRAFHASVFRLWCGNLHTARRPTYPTCMPRHPCAPTPTHPGISRGHAIPRTYIPASGHPIARHMQSGDVK